MRGINLLLYIDGRYTNTMRAKSQFNKRQATLYIL